MELPAETNGGRKVLTIGLVVVLLLAFTIGGLLFWVSRKIDPSGDPGELVQSIEIPTGSSTDSIAGILAKADVISDAPVLNVM